MVKFIITIITGMFFAGEVREFIVVERVEGYEGINLLHVDGASDSVFIAHLRAPIVIFRHLNTCIMLY